MNALHNPAYLDLHPATNSSWPNHLRVELEVEPNDEATAILHLRRGPGRTSIISPWHWSLVHHY